MAAKRDKEKSLEDLIKEAEALLESDKPRKKKKEIDFEFHPDSKTGKRPRNYKYRPRFKAELQHSAETCSVEDIKAYVFPSFIYDFINSHLR